MSESLIRLRDDAKQLRRAFAEPRVRFVVGLFLLAGLVILSVRLLYPAVFPSLVSDLLISVLGAVFGVYISVELLLPYVRHVERARIDAADEIVDSYDNPSSFLDLTALPGSRDRADVPERIPVTAEQLPSSLRSYDSFEHELLDRQYDVPDELAALYESDADELRALFRRENRTNGRKVRLESASADTFELSTTTYYRSFLTNFCPDYELSGGATIRELSKPLLFDGETPKPLSETPFSDHFGGGGLVITTDGRAVLPVRSRSVAVEGKALHLSFSGSFDVADVTTGGIDAALRSILTDELDLESSSVQSVSYLGTTRRIERLGKPDTVSLAFVDADAALDITTEQFVNSYSVTVCDEPVSDVEDLFEPEVARQVIECLLAAIDRRPYRPSLGLLSFLWLYWELVDRLDQHPVAEPESIEAKT
ncbi:hypothetical protein GS429_03945 [Natronorubrum sp. JWXQ-INN-674]|uniref:Uncharacterized protein n=1 Tax=Natronorubrum halalkaliphilum TaxID=2691917 RepID=A0A6B0VJT0_9EURY|nr:hypothetical protein [Natronorubrum halalkaliphilum]MXV61226.1 hypothetical protein [Natronorubrum halalkaliphilum]